EHLEGEDGSAGAKAAHRAADQAERLAGYLHGSDANGLLADLESFARRRPWAAGGIGVAAGFVAARFLKASSERRYETAHVSRRDADAPLAAERIEIASMPAVPQYRSW